LPPRFSDQRGGPKGYFFFFVVVFFLELAFLAVVFFAVVFFFVVAMAASLQHLFTMNAA
jgi:hypothetical protein